VSIAFGGIIAFVFRGANLVVALGTLLLATRLLDDPESDAFLLGITVVGFANAMTGGLTAAVAYQVSNQGKPAGQAFGGGLGPAIPISALVLAVAAVVAATNGGYLGAMAFQLGVAAAAVTLNSVVAGVLLGREAFLRYNITLVAGPLCALVFVATALLTVDDPGPGIAITAYTLGQVTGLVAVALLSLPLLLERFAVSRMLAVAVLAFAGLAAVSSGVSYLNYRADLFIVGYFEPDGGVTTYASAAYLGESIWQVSGSLALATYARLGILDRNDAAQLTARVMRHTFLLLVILCAGVFLFADVFEWILFPDYGGVSSALRFLLPGILIYSLAQAYSGFYTYQRGLPWVAAIVASLALVVKMALAFALVPPIGVDGAAIASSIGYTTAMVVALVVFARQERLSAADIFRFGPADLDDYRSLLSRVRTTLTRA
jgi:O-antigen/teichoic acid export membrane protein